MKAQNARSFSYVFVVDFKFGNIDQEIALLFFILIFSFYGDKKKVKQKVKNVFKLFFSSFKKLASKFERDFFL